MNLLQKLYKTCVSVNNNLHWKLNLLLESRIVLDERFKETWVTFFIPDLWKSCELDNFTFKVLQFYV